MIRTRLLLILLGLATTAVFAVPTARASDARTDGFGVQREYLEDYILFRSFPTVAARYDNLVAATLGTRGGDRGMGVIGSGQNTSYGTFAVFLNDLGNDFTQDAQLDLTWAKQFSGAALGLSLNWTGSSQEVVDTDSRVSPIGGGFNQLAVTGGVKLNTSDSSQLEAALELASLSFESGSSEDDAGLSYRLSARLMAEASRQTTLVPLVQYIHIDTSIKDSPERTSNTFNLGCAARRRVNGNDLLILGVAVNYASTKNAGFNFAGDGGEDQEESRWDLPALFAALEFSVYDWLTTRVGATKTIDMINQKTPGGTEVDINKSRFFFGLGIGLHFDHFDVDATVNPDAAFTGGYLFTGSSVGNPLTRITGTYYF